MNTLSSLKQSRKSRFDKLTNELNKLASKSEDTSSRDDNYWKPTVDKSGNGSAVIRFLPEPEGEDFPFVRYWTHGFQGPGGWYIEKSLSSINKTDPVMEYNGKLWNSGIESNKEIARKQKRNLHFVSNIYVVKDPANPNNEGKVFLYKYGKKIFDKIISAREPEFDDETPLDAFDLWEGANFRLRIRNVEGYRNYDKSDFDTSSALVDDDDELDVIWKKVYALKDIIDPKNFKSYEELKSRLSRVLGEAEEPAFMREEVPVLESPKVKETAASSFGETSAPWSSNDDGDDDMAFFKKLKDD